MAGSTAQLLRPMSTKEIALKAQDFNFNPFIPLKFWVRTADTLLREAQIYEQEENDQQAYLLLMRYAALVAEKLPLHPSAKDPEYKPILKAIQKTLPTVVDSLEGLKPRINARYIAWERSLERRRIVASLQNEALQPRLRNESEDPAIAGNTTTLGAAENSELAVKLAHQEIKRRTAARRFPRHSGVLTQDEQERRTAGLWDDWEAALAKDSQCQGEGDMCGNMEASRRLLDGSHDRSRTRLTRTWPSKPTNSSEFRYPAVAKSQPLSLLEVPESLSRPLFSHTPALPPKYSTSDTIRPKEVPPPRPLKETADASDAELSNPTASPPFTFRPSAYLENGKPLRTVFLPPTLRTEFLRHAESNTRRNLETCGMLCGTLISNALFIRRVVIPEQESTSDTCETTNEGALFDYCDKEDLLVLGWIHTHPSQTCFMSSRDLHTHAGYQIMMPESIAIVCAPSKTPSWGVFRLTDPPGMGSVLNCRQTGLFHPHDETNIYTDALRPGHVTEAHGMEFDVVDLRPR